MHERCAVAAGERISSAARGARLVREPIGSKCLNDIEVLDQPDTNYWTKVAYTIPDTPHATLKAR